MRYQQPEQAAGSQATAAAPSPSGTGTGSPSSSGSRLEASSRPQVDAGSVCGRGLRHDLEGGVDWGWLAGLRRSQRYGPVTRVDLDAGTTGGLLPAQYELEDRLVVQVTGRRRVLLLNPGQAFEGLYPYPIHHTYDRYCMVDLEEPDLGLWPKFSGVRGQTAILGPGDALYVPAYW